MENKTGDVFLLHLTKLQVMANLEKEYNKTLKNS